MKPTINAVSGDVGDISTIGEVHDNNAMPIDFMGMAERVAAAAKKNAAPMIEESSILRQIWSGIVEDFRGQKPTLSH